MSTQDPCPIRCDYNSLCEYGVALHKWAYGEDEEHTDAEVIATLREQLAEATRKIDGYKADPYCTMCGKSLPGGLAAIATAKAGGVRDGMQWAAQDIRDEMWTWDSVHAEQHASGPSEAAQYADRHLSLTKALSRVERRLAEQDEDEPCEHEWTDLRGGIVKSGEICHKCNAVRAGNRDEPVCGTCGGDGIYTSPQHDPEQCGWDGLGTCPVCGGEVGRVLGPIPCPACQQPDEGDE